MAQTEMGWPMSFALSAKNWAENKEQSVPAPPSLWPRASAPSLS